MHGTLDGNGAHENTRRHDQDDGYPLGEPHVELHDDRDREYECHDIHDNVQHTEDRHDGLGVHAAAPLYHIVPALLDGITAEDEHEGVDDHIAGRRAHEREGDYTEPTLGREAEIEGQDGEFGEDHGPGVDESGDEGPLEESVCQELAYITTRATDDVEPWIVLLHGHVP